MPQAIVTALLYAVSAVCAGRSTRILGGTEANFFRLTLATVLLGLCAHSFGQGLSGAGIFYFLLSGGVGFGIGDLALYQAFPRIGSRLAIMLVHCTAAPFAALLEWAWLGTRITPLQLLCGLTILGGVALALAPDKRLNAARGAVLAGVMFGIIAGCGQGFGAVVSRKAYQVAEQHGEQTRTLNAGMTAAYQRIVAGWFIGAAGFAILKYRQRHRGTREPGTDGLNGKSRWRRAWPWVLANGLSGPALGVSCQQWALAVMETAVVLPVIAMTPIAIIPLSRVIEGDRPSARSILGGVIGVVGVIALTLARHHAK